MKFDRLIFPVFTPFFYYFVAYLYHLDIPTTLDLEALRDPESLLAYCHDREGCLVMFENSGGYLSESPP